jgi:MoaA/NifB/PqqE/SkfB family radical SAM enzyme
MNLAIPDVTTLEIHPANPTHFTSCRRSTGAGTRNELGVPLLKNAIGDAARLGYNFLSITGEQSLFYPDLSALCRHAHQMRMLTTLTTRAGLLSTRRLKSLVHSIDLLGIRYEAGMGGNLEPVRKSGIPFALVYHLTSANMGELEPTAAFAAVHGAAMLHVVPDEEMSDQTMATVWMMIECLRDIHRGELALQLEVVNRYNMRSDAAELDTWLHNVAQDQTLLGDRISPLVIEEDGWVAPLRHGMPRSLGFGSLCEYSLAHLAADWIRNRAAGFCDLYARVLREARLFGDLHHLLAQEAASRAKAKVLPMRMATGV